MTSRRTAVLMVFCLLCFVFATGCASKYGTQTTRVERYPQCYAPIQQLRDAESRVSSQTATGGAIGAAGGALLGLIISGGKAEGALVGGVAGGLSGAAIGYSQAKQKQIADENMRMASYLRDIRGDISGLNAATASARMSIQCYEDEFNSLIARHKNGSLSKMEVQAAYAEIRSGIEESERILGAIISSARERDSQYQAAVSSEGQKRGYAPEPQAYQATRKSKASRSSKTTAPASNTLEGVKSTQEAYTSSIDETEKLKQEVATKKVGFDTKMDELTS